MPTLDGQPFVDVQQHIDTAISLLNTVDQTETVQGVLADLFSARTLVPVAMAEAMATD